MRDVTSTTMQVNTFPSSTDSAFAHSKMVFGESATHRAISLTLTKEKSVAELVKPPKESFVQRARNSVNSALALFGRKPAPAQAPLLARPSAPDAKQTSGSQKNRSKLETWRAVEAENLPRLYSSDEKTHPSYNAFKRTLCVAAEVGKEALSEAFKRLPSLSVEKRHEISSEFLKNLAENIWVEFDASYKATRDNFASARESFSMPVVLMVASQTALEKALETTSAEFEDASFAQVASNFVFKICDAELPEAPTRSMESDLPLKFSLAIKADQSVLDLEDLVDAQDTSKNDSSEIRNQMLAVAIWSPLIPTPKATISNEIEGYLEVDESEWIPPQPVVTASATPAAPDEIDGGFVETPSSDAIISTETVVVVNPEPVVSKEYKVPGPFEQGAIKVVEAMVPKAMVPKAVTRKKIVTRENPLYAPPEAKAAPNPAVVEVAQKRPAVGKFAKMIRSVRRFFNRILLKPSWTAKPGNSAKDDFKVFPRQADVNNNRFFDREGESVQLTKL